MPASRLRSSSGLIRLSRAHSLTSVSEGKDGNIEKARTHVLAFSMVGHDETYLIAANISLTSGVLSFFNAFASICRIRSRVTERLCPTCSSVLG